LAGVGYETVARWIRSGQLEAKKKRLRGKKRQWRIRGSVVLAFMET